MENNNQEIKITTIKDEIEMVATSMRNKMGSSVSSSKCCIYKVPEFIREGKEECYRPIIVSIGPLHYNNNPKLETMQQFKWIILKWFLKKGGDNSLEYYLNFIREKEDEIRDCYQENTKKIPSNEFIQMILLDAAFIIYQFLDTYKWVNFEIELPKEISVLMQSFLDRDLFLLENQLPYFILKNLYDKSFGTFLPNFPFTKVTRDYMGNLHLGTIDAIGYSSSIKHLIDFLCCCLPPHPREQRDLNKPGRYGADSKGTSTQKHDDQITFEQLLHFTAKELSAAGVKFKASESLNRIDIHFANGVLEIPTISVDAATESLFRNIIYFEQCDYSEASYFLDYIWFLDSLINTVEDIQILVESKILQSILGSHEEAVDLFNNVAKNSTFNGLNNYYSEVCTRLNAYAKTPWHRWKAILKRDYFSHPWSITSVIYLVVLLFLTILQVYTGFKGLMK